MTYKDVKIIDKEIHRLQSRLGVLESDVYSVTPKLSDAPSGGGTYYQELICTRLRMCSTVSKINAERSENNGS